MDFADIAALLGTGENAVRSNVSRGLRKLRVQLSEETDDAPGVAVVNGVR